VRRHRRRHRIRAVVLFPPAKNYRTPSQKTLSLAAPFVFSSFFSPPLRDAYRKAWFYFKERSRDLREKQNRANTRSCACSPHAKKRKTRKMGKDAFFNRKQRFLTSVKKTRKRERVSRRKRY
jgi:hypothetical protein